VRLTVSTSAINYTERLVPEMIRCVSCWTSNTTR